MRDGGSIPACAGERRSHPCPRSRSWVYPRVRGGTASALVTAAGTAGLSPRARGNRERRRLRGSVRGSIPACAGEPPSLGRSQSLAQVYPRVRGGTLSILSLVRITTGLSPRARGNLIGLHQIIRGARSIPACAGEPRFANTPRCRAPVYPRVRGGTIATNNPHATKTGLSPRARGNRSTVVSVQTSVGSIPACAGEPPRPEQPCPAPAVYPRVRGGTPIPAGNVFGWRGLSPRARGNRRIDLRIASVSGSIPACAGEPSEGGRRRGLGTVYPRVRGGT